SVIVITMRVKKQKVFFNTIEPQQHLGVAIRDEAENGAASRTSANIGYDANRGGAIRTHAIDHQVGQMRRQNVGLEQFSVRSMWPLLRAGPFLGQRLSEFQLRTRERTDVRRLGFLFYVPFNTFNDCMLKHVAPL